MPLSRSHLGQHRSVAPRQQKRLLQSRGGQQAWGRLPAALLGRTPSRVREPRELRARTRQPQLAPFSVSRVPRFSSLLQGRCKPSCNMNLRLCVQALLLLWLSLTAVCGGECVPFHSPGFSPGLFLVAASALLSFCPTRALPASQETRRELCRSSHAPATPGGKLTGHPGSGGRHAM